MTEQALTLTESHQQMNIESEWTRVNTIKESLVSRLGWQAVEGSTGKEMYILISGRAKGHAVRVMLSSPNIEAWM